MKHLLILSFTAPLRRRGGWGEANTSAVFIELVGQR
jgi:hypothetical protein